MSELGINEILEYKLIILPVEVLQENLIARNGSRNNLGRDIQLTYFPQIIQKRFKNDCLKFVMFERQYTHKFGLELQEKGIWLQCLNFL